MNYAEYCLAAPETCNPEAWCLEHWVDGIIDEATEFQGWIRKRHYSFTEEEIVTKYGLKLREELGDLSWFMTCYFIWRLNQNQHITATPFWNPEDPMGDTLEWPLFRISRQMVIKAGKLAEHLEEVEYGPDENHELHMDNIHGLILDIQYWMNVARLKLGLTWEEIWEKNITKLRARHKGSRFKKAAVDNRDIEAEEEALAGDYGHTVDE